MNWLKYILLIVQLAPTVIQGVEKLAADKDGASKHQMAKDALVLASGIAVSVLPENAEQVQAISAATSGIIDNTVAAFNTAGVFKKKSVA